MPDKERDNPDTAISEPDAFENPDVLTAIYAEAFLALPTIIFIYDIATQRNIFVNARFHEVIAFTHQMQGERGSDPLTNRMHVKDAARLAALWKQMATSTRSEQVPIKFRVLHASNEWIWLAGHAVVFRRTEEGVPRKILCSVENITEHKETQEKLHNHVTPMQAVLDAAFSAIVTMHENGTMEHFNQAAERIFGYSAEEVIGQKFEMLMPALYHEEQDGYFKDYQDTGEEKITGIGREVRGRRKDGSTFPLDLAVSEAWVGRRVFLSVMRDLTELSQADTFIREKANLIELAHDAIIVQDMERRIIFWNHGAEALYGWKQAEAIGKPMQELLQTRSPNSQEAMHKALLKWGMWEGELTQTRQDGTEVVVMSRMSVPYDEAGNPQSMIEIDRDITDQKHMEDTLRESELRLHLALKNAGQGLWDWNLLTGHFYRDANWAKLLGYNFEDMPSRREDWLKTVHPDDRERMTDIQDRHLQNPAVDYDVDFRVQHRSGKYVWMNSRGVAQRDADGKPVRMVGTLQDITARKQAEEEWNYLREHARCLIWYAEVWIDTEDEHLLWKQEFPSLEVAQKFLPLEVPPDSTYAQAFYNARFHEDRNRCNMYGLACIKVGQSYSQEYRTQTEDDTVRWLHEDVNVETIEEGKRWRTVSVCTDITATKQAEKSLRESQQRLQAIFDNALNGIMMLTNDRHLVEVNPAACAMLGYDREDLLAMPGVLPFVTDTSDIELKQLLREGKLQGVTRMRRKDGSLVTVEFSSVANVLPGMYLSVLSDVTEREKAADTLRESETRFRSLADFAPVLIWTAGLDKQCNHFNKTWLDFTGKTLEEEMGRDWREDTHPEDRQSCLEIYHHAYERREAFRMEYRLRYHDGTYRWLLDTGAPRFSPEGTFMGYIGSCVDINERKLLQEQLFESQKLESMGRLAGGIAHDFNNLLTAILGYTDLALTMLPEDAEERPFLDNVLTAGERAAELTKQLLMYARRQMVNFDVLNMNKVIMGMDPLLRRTIGAQYELVTLLTDEVCHIRANNSQMEQILMNLIVNARDAMPEGGRIVIETSCVTLDEDYARLQIGVTPGDYVLCSVSDNGTGMTADVRSRIFEPFYTTKEVGKGTGLGLATCYGIVKQSSGNIWVYSEPGVGTTFKIYLPQVRDAIVNIVLPIPDDLPTGTETILLVDDEPMVCDIATRTLQAQGYRVLSASNGAEALQLQSEWKGKIDLLVTDVVMPLMGGKVLAQRLLEKHPEIKVLFMSGYTQNVVLQQGALKPGILLLTKPFTAAGLAQKVREALTVSPPPLLHKEAGAETSPDPAPV